MSKVTGIILCGGKSCRFGKDKGLCTLVGQPMIQYPLDAIKEICDDIIISSNEARYLELGYKVIPDEIKNIGPIGGIYTCLKRTKTEDNIIVTCDMPFVNKELVKYIYDNRGDAKIASAFSSKFVEPLCSYFHKDTIPLILEMIEKKSYKMMALLESANFKKINIDNKLNFYEQHLFLNINSQSDYDKAEKIIRG